MCGIAIFFTAFHDITAEMLGLLNYAAKQPSAVYSSSRSFVFIYLSIFNVKNRTDQIFQRKINVCKQSLSKTGCRLLLAHENPGIV